jgi:hypothetical protein
MNPTQFCIWLKGFIEASHHYNLTPEAFQVLKDTLQRVSLNEETVIKYNQTNTLNNNKKMLYD